MIQRIRKSGDDDEDKRSGLRIKEIRRLCGMNVEPEMDILKLKILEGPLKYKDSEKFTVHIT